MGIEGYAILHKIQKGLFNIDQQQHQTVIVQPALLAFYEAHEVDKTCFANKIMNFGFGNKDFFSPELKPQ